MGATNEHCNSDFTRLACKTEGESRHVVSSQSVGKHSIHRYPEIKVDAQLSCFNLTERMTIY